MTHLKSTIEEVFDGVKLTTVATCLSIDRPSAIAVPTIHALGSALAQVLKVLCTRIQPMVSAATC